MSKASLSYRLTHNKWLVVALLMVMLMGAIAPRVFAVNGNINPGAIQIDNGVAGSDHYPGLGTPLNSGALLDWVKDGNASNTGTSCLGADAIALCNEAGVTAATTGKGTWNGARIVDGIASSDQDIFLTGGKENEHDTWNIGPGSVGSSKYDITQAYLANNQSNLYFGMERAGNNGTTAFDFEFSQNAPKVNANGSTVPDRAVGDVLFTFEMQGSGGSGSATPYRFTWDGTKYVSADTGGIISSINKNTDTPAAPWGHVNSKGQWTTSNLARFEFAEAAAPLSVFGPDFNACDGAAYVQIRTRSSSVETSDLKDTTKIFQYEFGGPEAAAKLKANCDATFEYDGAGSEDSSGGTSNITYNWDIAVSPSDVTLSGGGVQSTATAGQYTSTAASGKVNVSFANSTAQSAQITVNNTVLEGGSCDDASGNKVVTVYRHLGATATLTAQCDNKFAFSSNVSGGKAPYTYAWTFEKNSAADGSGTWGAASGTFLSGSATSSSGVYQAASQGQYRALLEVKDSADTSTDPDVTGKPQCTANTTSNAINVYDAVGGSISLTPDCDDTFGYSASGSGGKAPYTYDFTVQRLVSGAYVDAGTFQMTDTLASPGVSGELDSDNYGGNGTYRLLVTITDSQGLQCLVNKTAGPIDVAEELAASAEKASATRSTLTANMSGSAPTADVLQWQIKQDGAWVNISSATAATLAYSSFEADTSPTIKDFTLDGIDFKGQMWSVELRLKATRTLNGQVCVANSDPVTVKMLKAVDP